MEVQVRRKKRRPRKRWMDSVEEDLREKNKVKYLKYKKKKDHSGRGSSTTATPFG